MDRPAHEGLRHTSLRAYQAGPRAPRGARLRGWLAATTTLLAGCFAAPTPHPADDAVGVAGNISDALSDSGPGSTGYAEACATAGGRWDAGREVCDFDFAAGIDGDFADGVDASAAPAGDEGATLNGDADSQSSQGADAGAEQPAPTATVTAVEARGEAGDYTFAVSVASADEGCDQYADWWEVLRPDGTLVYRRLMSHSHVDEQPFTREGGPVPAAADEVLVVRAHIHGQGVGFGPAAMVGTVQGGFAPTLLPDGFAWKLAEADPLPPACAF